MEKTKCVCCDNEMSRFSYEEYENMSQEEKALILQEHKEDCAWAKQFDSCFYEDKYDLDAFTLSVIRSFKLDAVVDILIENNILSKDDLKARMIKKAGRAVDLDARDKMIKYINEKQ